MKEDEKLYEAISNFMRRRDRCSLELADALGSSELVAKQFFYLEIIDQNRNLTSSKFAKILGITKPSVTEIINKLIRVNCVYKKKDSNDGRVFYIELSEKGRNIARFKSTGDKKLVNEIYKVLDSKEQENLIKILNKISSSYT